MSVEQFLSLTPGRVFGSGLLTIKQMAREGIVLNLIGAAVIAGSCYLLLP